MLPSVDALLLAVDSENVIDEQAIDFFFDRMQVCKKVVMMSRHLNGEGMGAFANIAKKVGNAEIWR